MSHAFDRRSGRYMNNSMQTRSACVCRSDAVIVVLMLEAVELDSWAVKKSDHPRQELDFVIP
jgi:hypothetical protein